ncbi:MAG: MCE family protein [Acidimicrobiales bacterium]
MRFWSRLTGSARGGEPARPVLIVLGIVMATMLIGSGFIVFASFSGTFGDYVTIKADLPSTGNAVQLKGPVAYRDVTVGAVASQGVPLDNHTIEVEIRAKPSRLKAVPSNVRATVGPLSIFGNQEVILEAPSGPPARALRAGDTIAAVPNAATSSLQSTLSDLDTLLNAVHPAQLNAALTALATALKGQGQAFGAALDAGSSYLGTLNPLLPTLYNDLQLLIPVLNQVSASTPDILSVFANITVTSQTVVSYSTQLRQLLIQGGTTAAAADQLLTVIEQPFKDLLLDAQPLLADVSANPNELSQILAGLDAWSKAWGAAESQGPYLSLSTVLQLPNEADVVLSAFGGPGADRAFAHGVGVNKVNPQTYTAAQCPRYGSLAGANCSGVAASSLRRAELAPVPGSVQAASAPAAGSTPAAAAAAATPPAVAPDAVTPAVPQALISDHPVLGSQAQQQAVSEILAALNGGAPPALVGVATLLIGPLLNAMQLNVGSGAR